MNLVSRYMVWFIPSADEHGVCR